MAKRVKGPDGITRIFPDDATDEEIGAALQASIPTPPNPREPKMSAAAPGSALPDTYAGLYEAKWGEKPLVGEGVVRVVNDPLVRPTGIEAIDSMSSPLNLIMSGAGIVKPAAQAAFRSLAGLASSLNPEVADHLIGLLSPRVGHGVKLSAAVKSAMKASTPAATETAAPAVAEAAAVKTGAPPSVPSSQPLPVAAGPFNPTTALQQAREAFVAIGEAPYKAEASNAMELIRRGVSPPEAVARVIKNRPATLNPAEAFNQRFGTLTDDQARAALDLRNARGQIKTPSAQTARQRRGQP